MDKGVVEVTNCFCVPHKEHADQVEAELGYASDLYDLNRRVNPSENIVGECGVNLSGSVGFAGMLFYCAFNILF